MSETFENRMIKYTNRLYELAQEQHDKRNMAMHFVLDDICDGIKEAVSDEANGRMKDE